MSDNHDLNLTYGFTEETGRAVMAAVRQAAEACRVANEQWLRPYAAALEFARFVEARLLEREGKRGGSGLAAPVPGTLPSGQHWNFPSPGLLDFVRQCWAEHAAKATAPRPMRGAFGLTRPGVARPAAPPPIPEWLLSKVSERFVHTWPRGVEAMDRCDAYNFCPDIQNPFYRYRHQFEETQDGLAVNGMVYSGKWENYLDCFFDLMLSPTGAKLVSNGKYVAKGAGPVWEAFAAAARGPGVLWTTRHKAGMYEDLVIEFTGNPPKEQVFPSQRAFSEGGFDIDLGAMTVTRGSDGAVFDCNSPEGFRMVAKGMGGEGGEGWATVFGPKGDAEAAGLPCAPGDRAETAAATPRAR